MNALINAFVRHPQTVDETYGEHAVFAGRFACKLILAGLAALVHAIFPFAFEKTASKMIIEMHDKITNRS